MALAFKAVGVPAARNRAPGFGTLLRIIIDQQISVQAGAAIWAKLETRLGEISVNRILEVSPVALHECGLSRQKAEYASELAQAVRSGSLNFEELEKQDDETAIRQLTGIKGIGTWTAEIYLIFAMSRPDVLPAGDLALQIAARDLLGLAERPKANEFRRIAQRWSPYRSAASIILWQYYRMTPI